LQEAEQVSPGRRRAFVICTIVFGVVIGLGLFGLVSLVTGWFEGGERLVHRVHDLGYGGLGGIILSLPLLLQAKNPEGRPAAMQQYFLGVAAYAVGIALALDFTPLMVGFFGLFAVMGVVLVWLHPARSQVLGPRTRPSVALAILVLAAAVPLVLYAVDMAALQRAGPPTDPHVEEHHWTTMAALAVGIILVGVLASLRTPGWRIPAWSAGGAAAVLGLASIVFSGYPGALATPWSYVALGGGLAFIAVAEWLARRGRPVERGGGSL
jgi:hypothetical protein